MDNNQKIIDSLLELGEGQFVEFKESIDKHFSKEIVAFANATGGVIYLGIADNGKIKGIDITNKLKANIQDYAYNCDPSIMVSITEMNHILAVEILEGNNKPYSCSSGFYMRMGANSQKMKRDEILTLAVKYGKISFDEQICYKFDWKDFDDEKFEYYLKLAKISNILPKEEILSTVILGEEALPPTTSANSEHLNSFNIHVLFYLILLKTLISLSVISISFEA